MRASDTDRKWSELRTILEDNDARPPADGESSRASSSSSPSTATPSTTSRAGSARCSAGPRRSRRSTAACAAASGARSPRSSRSNPDCPGPARHRRRRRGPQPAGRAPDGQLRPAVEPEPDRAALRPHPPHRPDRGLPAVEPRRRATPARARSSPGCSRRSRSSARPTAARSSTSSARRSTRRRCATCCIEAIRYGEQPETRGQDGEGHRRQRRATASRSCSTSARSRPTRLPQADIAQLRALMDEARARRLQPHYIEGAFRAAFTRLGGTIRRREQGRFEITHVPRTAAHSRAAARSPPATSASPSTSSTSLDDAGARAELLAPGHPLHDAVIDETDRAARQQTLERGTVLVSPTLEEPHLLVGVIEEIADATGDRRRPPLRLRLRRRARQGQAGRAGAVPRLRRGPADRCRHRGPSAALARGRRGARRRAGSSPTSCPSTSTRSSRAAQAELRARPRAGEARLDQESNRLILEAMVAQEKEQAGKKPKESHDSLMYKAADLEAPARSAAGAARPPAADVSQAAAGRHRRARAAAGGGRDPRSAERRADARDRDQGGRAPRRRPRSRDRAQRSAATRSSRPSTTRASTSSPTRDGEDPIRIEVKARIAGAEDFFVTHNEVLTAMNSAPRYRLALVRVDPRRPEHDEVRYLENPFDRLRRSATSTPPASRQLGQDMGTRPGAVLSR